MAAEPPHAYKALHRGALTITACYQMSKAKNITYHQRDGNGLGGKYTKAISNAAFIDIIGVGTGGDKPSKFGVPPCVPFLTQVTQEIHQSW